MKDLTGQVFGLLTVQCFSNKIPRKTGSGYRYYWKCICKCGKESLVNDDNLKRTNSCGCLHFVSGRKNKRWKGVGDLSANFFVDIRHGALRRGYEFSLTKEFLWNLFLKQEKKCALSGLELKFHSKVHLPDATASLDRKDNKKGYIEDNVWWVHKDINLMKQKLTINQFLKYCKLITEKSENDE